MMPGAAGHRGTGDGMEKGRSGVRRRYVPPAFSRAQHMYGIAVTATRR